MTQPGKNQAWLEDNTGARSPLGSSCSFGRTATNTVVLDSPKVSRQHALIHLQNIGEFWLIDFGSSNGTFLNRRRIRQPVRLSDGDQITIGDQNFRFCQPLTDLKEYRAFMDQGTLHNMENVLCWLLVADIRDFTPLSRTVQTEGLDALLGSWISSCKEIIETRHGIINKYLGDGFLAYWPDAETTAEEIAAVICALKELQQTSAPDFRVVVHFGPVAIGGMAPVGEERLMGREVNMIFRMEKLAGLLKQSCALSEQARAKLHGLIPTHPLGEHDLKGFDERCLFFAA